MHAQNVSTQGEQQDQPCSDIASAIIDFTGGDSNQSFVDDVVNNFVDTKDALSSSVVETGLSVAGAGVVARSWGGITPVQALLATWTTYQSSVRIPGLIGIRTGAQLLTTTAASWLYQAALIKGSYNAGVLAGSVLRTAINRAAAATCRK